MTVGVTIVTNIRLLIAPSPQKVSLKKTQSKMRDCLLFFAEGLNHADLVFLIVAGGIVLLTCQSFQ